MLRKSFKTFDLYGTLVILVGVLYALGPVGWGAIIASFVMGSYLWSRAICKMNTANHYSSLKSMELYVFLALQVYLFQTWYQAGDVRWESYILMSSWVSLSINMINWNLSRSLVKHIVRVPNVML